MVLCLYISFTGCYTSMYNWVWDHLIVRITHLYQLYYMAVCYLRNLWQRSRLKTRLRSRSVLFSSWSNKNYSNSAFNAFCCCCCWQVDFTKALWSKKHSFRNKKKLWKRKFSLFSFFEQWWWPIFFMWLKLRLHMPSTSSFCERHLWSSWRCV